MKPWLNDGAVLLSAAAAKQGAGAESACVDRSQVTSGP